MAGCLPHSSSGSWCVIERPSVTRWSVFWNGPLIASWSHTVRCLRRAAAKISSGGTHGFWAEGAPASVTAARS